jgi:hypothetical protein
MIIELVASSEVMEISPFNIPLITAVVEERGEEDVLEREEALEAAREAAGLLFVDAAPPVVGEPPTPDLPPPPTMPDKVFASSDDSAFWQ